jgi:hypothetical protein
MEGHDAVPVLAELLGDPNPRVRSWAAGILLFMQPPPRQAVPALLATWRRYKDDFLSASVDGAPRGADTPWDAACGVRLALWRIDPEAARRAGVPEAEPADDP